MTTPGQVAHYVYGCGQEWKYSFQPSAFTSQRHFPIYFMHFNVYHALSFGCFIISYFIWFMLCKKQKLSKTVARKKVLRYSKYQNFTGLERSALLHWTGSEPKVVLKLSASSHCIFLRNIVTIIINQLLLVLLILFLLFLFYINVIVRF